MQYTISVLLNNEPGALARVVELFAARGYNLDRLCVEKTQDGRHANATIVTSDCDENTVINIVKQLNRIIPVISANFT